MSIEYTYNNITTNEDVMRIIGIDLNDELVTVKVNDSNANIAEQAINNIEEWLIDYINTNYAYDGDKEDLSDFQKDGFKKAVCFEIDYLCENGDLRNLSGINQDNNTIIDIATLQRRGLAPSAYMTLKKHGLANIERW